MSAMSPLKTRIRDALVLLTDRCMREVYGPEVLAPHNTDAIEPAGIEALNMACRAREVLTLFETLPRRFFLICGSSNFHHLDAGFLTRLRRECAAPLQLLLFDRHMDCQRYRDSVDVLNCGNWVSYACRHDLVGKVILLGCRDYRRFIGYDRELFESARLYYHPDIARRLPDGVLDMRLPTCVSVDTDILSLPSDWGRGDYTLAALLASPVWQQIAQCALVGASVQGHVSEGRMLGDMLAVARRSAALCRTVPWHEQLYDAAYIFACKGWAALSTRPLPLWRQLDVIQDVVRRIELCR